uniref:Uncharacterized protein n=1 Tax=Glossina austeni TaxID=7395 RepID=A0A1A9UJV4_GLOAU
MADKDMSRDHFIFRIFTRFALKSLATRLMAACRSRLRGLIMPDGPSLSMKKKRMPLMVTSFSKVNLGPFGSTIQRNSNAYGVGLWPQIPLNMAGNRDEPPMSDVKPNNEAPLASSAASPPDDPPGVRFRSSFMLHPIRGNISFYYRIIFKWKQKKSANFSGLDEGAALALVAFFGGLSCSETFFRRLKFRLE